MFKKLERPVIFKVKIENGDYIAFKGKWFVAINSLSGLKYISDVLYMPNIDHNLLSVRQLMKKGFKVIFEDKWCLINDNIGNNVFGVKMKTKGFTLNLMEEEQSVLAIKHAMTNYGIEDLDIFIMLG